MKKILLLSISLILLLSISSLAYIYYYRPDIVIEAKNTYNNLPHQQTAVTQTYETQYEINTNEEGKEEIKLIEPPVSKILSSEYHIFQTFNNCGPASLSMTLRYRSIFF